MGKAGSRIVASFLGLLLAAPARGQVTQRVSLGPSGAQFASDSLYPAISNDGRYVAFSDGGVYVRDRQSGTTELVSISSGGASGNGASSHPSISPDGRYVAFQSLATNLVPGDTNGSLDVFVRDRQAGTTERVSVSTAGVQGNGDSYAPSISADGQRIAFLANASNLVANDSNGHYDVFVRDRSSGTTACVSLTPGGVPGDADSALPAISADGRFVAFESVADDLVPGDVNQFIDVFVRDLQNGTTERVSVATGGAEAWDASYMPAISADGRYVSFSSWADNLVPGDVNFSDDIFVRDRLSGTTELVSIATSGAQEHGICDLSSSISADGRYVAFVSSASDLVPGDTNGVSDTFLRDRQRGTTERVSVASDGTQGNGNCDGSSVSADGRYVAFASRASQLVPGDTNAHEDVFVRDRAATGFTSLCVPGVDGVRTCPCSNPPGAGGRGCDNSAGTGGAVLSASGSAYLSSDELVFTTSGERLTALSTVWQGTARLGGGLVFGQGVRCAGGTLKRLFSKNAVGGSITAPQFGAGDPSISARSAAKGDLILAGESRYYFVSYRDPIVLGGCAAVSTFNATQTGQVSWNL